MHALPAATAELAPGLLARLFARRPARPVSLRLAEERQLMRQGASESARLAAELLAAPSALVQLSPLEAAVVVRYMQPLRIGEGACFIREGDAVDTGFMVLLLDGEVAVENRVAGRPRPLTVTVLGTGSLIGEMGLIDGSPRSASCTAMSPVRCALLTREALQRLLADDPRTAAKLMMAITARIAARMRESQDKLKVYTQLTQAMNEEINDLMPL